jgi:hypothetical protein
MAGPLGNAMADLLNMMVPLVSALTPVITAFANFLTNLNQTNPGLLTFIAGVGLVVYALQQMSILGSVVGLMGGMLGALLDLNPAVLIVIGSLALLGGAIYELVNNWSSVISFFTSIPGEIESIFSDAGSWLMQAGSDIINGLVSGIESAAGGIWNAMTSVVGDIFSPLQSIPVIGSLIPGRALGGPVMAGQSYMVGERGPELFRPSSSGTIFPNGSGMGGGNQVVVNIDASGNGSPAAAAQAVMGTLPELTQALYAGVGA